MSKYIDAEALKRDLIDNRSFFPAIVARAIEDAPAVDAVRICEVERMNKPIIRHCKNCKWYYLNLRKGFDPLNSTFHHKECEVKYINIRHQRLAALLCRYYTQMEGTDNGKT